MCHADQPGGVLTRQVPGLVAGLVAITIGLSACHGSAATARSSAVSSPVAPAGQGTVWLCRPGAATDPCTATLTATVVPATGARAIKSAVPDTTARFDCFYVYPTVSTELTPNADLVIQPAEINTAKAQASRFSLDCRVWAPMYRQRTLVGLVLGPVAGARADAAAYASLLSAWNDYIEHDNDGRPIVFIGHSQGAAMLIRLLSTAVDPNPVVRARTVVAILAGGNVTVPDGKLVGASFAHLPLCTAAREAGCVIAYSSFPSQPPPSAFFGRPGQGVSVQAGQTATANVHVACVNPAAISGGTAALDPYFPATTAEPPPPLVTTPWVSYPSLYRASCQSGGGATWLQVDTTRTPGDERPSVQETVGPNWGYHLADINLALGNLVADVALAEAGWTASAAGAA